MKINIEVYSPKSTQYNKILLTRCAADTIVASGISSLRDKEINLSVALVDEKEMKRVNKCLRGEENVTNVLSIGDYSDQKNIRFEKKNEVFLGEVILCYNYIEQIASKNDSDVNKEFFTIYAHGILHLLGFKHGKKMFNLQDCVGKKYII